jgi:hypothetical protein
MARDATQVMVGGDGGESQILPRPLSKYITDVAGECAHSEKINMRYDSMSLASTSICADN